MTLELLTTRDGPCPAHVFRPDGKGPWPAVIVYMDAFAIRPAMLEIGERLARNGYLALVPDLFHRFGSYPPADVKAFFADPELRKARMEKVAATTKREAIEADTGACLQWLSRQADVQSGGIGVTGYCMGGRIALTVAGLYPEQIKASASFHGGGLASDSPESPHLLAPRMRARVLVAGAIEDASFPDDMKARLEAALTQAGVAHTVETYPAKHGWVFSDLPVYDAAASERHWQALLALFDATLKKKG